MEISTVFHVGRMNAVIVKLKMFSKHLLAIIILIIIYFFK